MSARPTYYQILGVSPTAGADEIARAFARESSVFRPHVFGGLTEVCVAYEVLRNPVKRQAYDVSIGLERKPKTVELSSGLRGAATAETMTRAAPVERRVPAPASQPEPPPASTKPALPLGPGEEANIRPEPSLGRGDPAPFPFESALEAEVRPVDWKRAGIMLGGFVLAACTLGGLAGWWSASDISAASPPGSSANAPIPAMEAGATPPAPDIVAERAVTPIVPAQRPDRPRPAASSPRAESKRAAAPLPEPETRPEQEQAEPALDAPEDAAPAALASASPMPLPNRVIARTIDRIGYSCGSVASTTPVDGAPGVYTVSCSSGQSYRASPVNGRYRFRRLGRQ